uniref:No apical meristem-associated C-terminal domain-containing protein n=1 Tax=Tanacetum cinerariifolium TaxID=118510 RepID=A0A6L2LHE5_TANCI|nr:hypothetical protein [Tanacetum cinerariifolium]
MRVIKREILFGTKHSTFTTSKPSKWLEDAKQKYIVGGKYKWQNPESTQERRTRGRVTEEEPELYGDDVISRPSGAPRKSKAQRSTSSSVTSGSQKEQFSELMQQQILLDHEAKKESMDRKLSARLADCEIQKNEELKVLTFDTTGMNPEDASKIEALKDKIQATYFNF